MNRRVIVAGVDVTDAVRAAVDGIPPLDAEQRARIRALLRPATSGAVPARKAA